ncbi:uncharacterized protein C8R40DRAFT_1085678 [Lentinula edodes]|uniref:uncharacterized protein n=1 Tax=Lentinula edodes TaxID=5353 RepID=UPI001E8D7117|nr:uncharacterized protein C8R40DRAFT_1085678 [Lentinula edodes]KAH7879238.1 hypothetical protein C8R40DRAFT_1085678 [Lentinula edodes]
MLQNEQKRERLGTEEDGRTMVKELTAYLYRESPFDIPVKDASKRLEWWNHISKDSGACQVSKLGIKLFSVSPSEMCDERGASKLSGLDTAKRNGLTGQNLIWMAQLQQYWRYGFSDPKYTHTARLDLDQPSTSSSIQLPAPTLNDLLNPAGPEIDEENLSFNISDPYGATALEDGENEDDEEMDDTGVIPIITRASIDRLKIESLVNLSCGKLLERYDPPSQMKNVPKEKPSNTQSQQASKKWSAKDSEWSLDSVW